MAKAAREDDESLPPKYSEVALASRFTELHEEGWRYVAEQSKWYRWDEKRWVADLTLLAFDRARDVARAAAAAARSDPDLSGAARSRIATTIASAKTVAAIERLARADRAHALTADEFDRDPWLLNCQGGVLDLVAGKMRSQLRQYLMTRLAGGSPEGERPTWTAFLDRITNGDDELSQFLQRWAGYCLTGETREHKLLFLWGVGSNGKSTFANAVMAAFGDYATTAPSETFVESHLDRHPTDLAMLRGARLVVVQEVEDGQRWAASKIKQLTGGDMVRARFMRQDFFEYRPQFKLMFCGNHKPAFRHVDEAIRRRFLLVPFTSIIGPDERDLTLPEKLHAERAGILRWALEGCLQWQEKGLAPPAKVREATEAYLEDEDTLRTWATECCEHEVNAFSVIAELHQSYHAWAERAGEKFFGVKRFSQMLEDHGYQRDRGVGNRARGFRGVRLKIRQERFEVVQ
jgi:putative DNA primase/helicase